MYRHSHTVVVVVCVGGAGRQKNKSGDMYIPTHYVGSIPVPIFQKIMPIFQKILFAKAPETRNRQPAYFPGVLLHTFHSMLNMQ